MKQVEDDVRILRITVTYERMTFFKNDQSEVVATSTRRENLILDGKTKTLEHCQEGNDISCVQRYYLPSKIDWALELLDRYDTLDSPALIYGDCLPNPNVTATFTITMEYTNGEKKQRQGHFNQLELPPFYQDFIRLVELLKDSARSEMLSPELANQLPRRQSDLMFCRVSFHPGERAYSYLCEIPSIQSGTWVFVPVRKENRMAVGYVERVEYRQPDNAPFPLDKIKKVCCECTQQALQDLEDSLTEAEKATNAAMLRSRMCPLFGCKLYKRGRGGCMDVQALLDDEDIPMDIFPKPFDIDEAFEICDECEWSDRYDY